MARPLRIEYKGAVYHVMSRGNRGEDVFPNDPDREYFLGLLERTVAKYGIDLYAYCIMGNHYHLLMASPLGKLSETMHFLGSSYGSYLRRHRGWIGHVFAGRYKSLCVEKEGHLMELSRYIYLNPVRAGIVKKPEEYPWSSYPYYIGVKKSPEWLNTGWLLEEYGSTKRTAQRKYREFVTAAVENPQPFPTEQVVGQAILGGSRFVKKVIKEIGKDRGLREASGRWLYKGGIDLEDLKKTVSKFYGIKGIKGNMTGMSEEQKRGREMFIYLAKEETTALNRAIAEVVGMTSGSGVTHCYKRIANQLKKDERQLREWKREAGAILSRFKG